MSSSLLSWIHLEVYARKMERQRDTGARMDALLRPAQWGASETPIQSHAAVS